MLARPDKCPEGCGTVCRPWRTVTAQDWRGLVGYYLCPVCGHRWWTSYHPETSPTTTHHQEDPCSALKTATP